MMLYGTLTNVESLSNLFVASAKSQVMQNHKAEPELLASRAQNETSIRRALARSLAGGSSFRGRLDVQPPGCERFARKPFTIIYCQREN